MNNSPTSNTAIGYESLMGYRISRVLMICSNYDAFIMEEDGKIEKRIYEEYIELNLSHFPKFTWANSSSAARKLLQDNDFDIVICMFNETDKDIFPLASELKASGREIPFVLLMHYSKQIRRKITEHPDSAVDFVFSWHGNADLILAIVKFFEDRKNADMDILGVGVQAILLVEDSIRYYSTYLPELYKIVLTQSNEFLKETLNEDQQKNRKRSRPKILLATCYDDAVQIYEKYKGNILGIISDVGMVLHHGDPPRLEKLDAGIDLVKYVRARDPFMPVLMQSSQGSMAEVAKELGVGFVRKYSRALFLKLSDYMKEEFGFGDFVFRDASGVEYGRAANLQQLEAIIQTIPDDVLVSNTSKNMFSKWFFARGLFSLASRFRSVHHDEASAAREFFRRQVRDFRKSMGRGIIASFSNETYDSAISFARLGDGSLGGKARGLAFLNRLVEKHNLNSRYEGISVSIPRSVVITTDYFDEFIRNNGLQYIIDSDLSDDEILSEFVASRLPSRLLEKLKVYISTVSTPLAVRSSSKLEDSNYQPFAGVYATYMVPCAENHDQMLRMLSKAIKSVYASAYYNGSRTYIQSTGNLQSEEKMAVIIQNTCGSAHEGLYFPLISGVARSVNFYPIGNEKAEDGVVNVVLGLGKAVVEGGHTLRFSPRFPRKILQLSQPDLAMRDSQRTFFALDMRPGAFKISRNEGINLASPSVTDIIGHYEWSSLVFSTFDRSFDALVPGVEAKGPRVVSFEAILKYGRFPLAQAIREIMDICRSELMCEVEMEFAADINPQTETMSLKLLQVRPVSNYSSNDDMTLESVMSEIKKTIVTSSRALGAGYIGDVKHILYIPPERFDNLKTTEIAAEIAAVNAKMKNVEGGYLLIGPGRWGSCDRNLGIPVIWSDISEARIIVECNIPGFRVEPSQGTHFFQNITSLGVGYLTVDVVSGDGTVDTAYLDSLPSVEEGQFTRLIELPGCLSAYIDRNNNQAVIGLQ